MGMTEFERLFPDLAVRVRNFPIKFRRIVTDQLKRLIGSHPYIPVVLFCVYEVIRISAAKCDPGLLRTFIKIPVTDPGIRVILGIIRAYRYRDLSTQDSDVSAIGMLASADTGALGICTYRYRSSVDFDGAVGHFFCILCSADLAASDGRGVFSAQRIDRSAVDADRAVILIVLSAADGRSIRSALGINVSAVYIDIPRGSAGVVTGRITADGCIFTGCICDQSARSSALAEDIERIIPHHADTPRYGKGIAISQDQVYFSRYFYAVRQRNGLIDIVTSGRQLGVVFLHQAVCFKTGDLSMRTDIADRTDFHPLSVKDQVYINGSRCENEFELFFKTTIRIPAHKPIPPLYGCRRHCSQLAHCKRLCFNRSASVAVKSNFADIKGINGQDLFPQGVVDIFRHDKS